jgi:ATP-binding cassette subfamily F protein 3
MEESPVLRLSAVSKSFGGRQVLDAVNFELAPGDKVALVGPNGAGKTTLLRLALGEEEPDAGHIRVNPNWQVGYLPQDAGVCSGRSLWDEMMAAYGDLLAIQGELSSIEAEMAGGPEEERLIELCDRQGELLAHFEQLGGYRVEAEIAQILAGLGFSPDERDKPTDQFSGGWQMRIALAKLLVRKPDLLLLDEPTNHLDLAATEWFEAYLRQSSAAVLLVSHDRYFLDRVISRTVELDDARLTDYRGNYTYYLAEKERRRAAHAAAYDRQQKYLARQRAFIERFKAKASKAAAAKSRERQLGKIPQLAPPKAKAPVMKLRFPDCRPSGRDTLTLHGLKKSFGRREVFKKLNLLVERGERIALVGPNGAGKSTLLKLIAGFEQPTAGQLKLGDNAVVGYYAQDQSQTLDESRTVVEEALATAPAGWSIERIRSLLGRFLFSQDDVEKRIGVLSGGEKSRLSLAKLLLRPANVLLLDEPTNHLDVPSREALEEALRAFPGTILMASHDRYFMDRLATRIAEVDDGGLKLYLGNYSQYREGAVEAGSSTFVAADGTPASSYRAKQRKLAPNPIEVELDAVEAELERLTDRRAELEDALGKPERYDSPAALEALTAEYGDLVETIEATEARWEELSNQLLATA